MGLPILGFDIADIPHTISYALMYRLKINSFNELTKDKRPPRNLWDKSSRLDEYFDELFKTPNDRVSTHYDINPEDVEG